MAGQIHPRALKRLRRAPGTALPRWTPRQENRLPRLSWTVRGRPAPCWSTVAWPYLSAPLTLETDQPSRSALDWLIEHHDLGHEGIHVGRVNETAIRRDRTEILLDVTGIGGL